MPVQVVIFLSILSLSSCSYGSCHCTQVALLVLEVWARSRYLSVSVCNVVLPYGLWLGGLTDLARSLNTWFSMRPTQWSVDDGMPNLFDGEKRKTLCAEIVRRVFLLTAKLLLQGRKGPWPEKRPLWNVANG